MFGKEIDDAILSAALEDNKEICGYIQGEKLVLVPNESHDPESEFFISNVPDDVQAIIHSHPQGPFYPSAEDMAQQVATDIPWAIASYVEGFSEVFWFGTGVPTPQLIGRGFRHGVSDCYELIRDVYTDCFDVTLKQFPRSWEWWANDQNLYDEGFASAGFARVSASEIKIGDVLIMSVMSPTSNHAAVYAGDGLIIHHLCGRTGYDPSRLSLAEPAERWMKYVSKVVRYENNPIEGALAERLRRVVQS